MPIALGINLEYEIRKENYNKEIDSILFSIDSIPIYDFMVTDSIIGYNLIQNFDTISNSIFKNVSSTINRYSFGFSVPINLYNSRKFGVIFTPGFHYNLNKYTFNNGSPTLKLSSYQYQLKLELYYDWRRLRFLAGFDSRFEKIAKNSFIFTKDTNHWIIGPNFSIGFKL